MIGELKNSDIEDLYIQPGDFWEANNTRLRVFRKIYVILANNEDYTIRIEGEGGNELKRTKTSAAPTSASNLPDIPNMDPSTHQYKVTIAKGDELVDKGKTYIVKEKTFRLNTQDLIEISLVSEPK